MTPPIRVAIVRGMDLAAYLEKHGISQERFARKLGVSQGLVWQWLNGRTLITAEMAAAIERKTNGKVRRVDLRPEVFGKLPA